MSKHQLKKKNDSMKQEGMWVYWRKANQIGQIRKQTLNPKNVTVKEKWNLLKVTGKKEDSIVRHFVWNTIILINWLIFLIMCNDSTSELKINKFTIIINNWIYRFEMKQTYNGQLHSYSAL